MKKNIFICVCVCVCVCVHAAFIYMGTNKASAYNKLCCESKQLKLERTNL
jgi:hypothetical protein